MTATTGSLFNLQAERIEEVINKNIDIILPTMDPVWRDTIVTSQGVGPADSIGRDMQIIKVFQGGLAGVLEQAKPRGDFVLYGDDTDNFGPKLFKQNIVQSWPDPREGANQRPYRLAVPMRAMVSNLMMTMGELQAEALPAFIGEIIAPKLEGFARNISDQLCNYWYTSQNSNFELCLLPTGFSLTVSDDTATSGGYSFEFEPDNEAVNRFQVGQMLDIYDATLANGRLNDTVAVGSQAHSTRIRLFVSSVDELGNRVRVVSSTDPSSGWQSAPAAGDRVVYANSDSSLLDGGTVGFTGIAGINSWLKSGTDTYSATVTAASSNNWLLGTEALSAGTFNDTIEVSRQHPEHRSFTKALGGATLTEHKLRQYLRRFHSAKTRYGYTVDCLIASDGVWLGYEGTKIGREYLDRTGRLSSLQNEGTAGSSVENDGFHFSMDGRSYMGYTSTHVEKQTVYGIKKSGGNWKRYVPPDPRGVKNFDRADTFIPFRFVAGTITGTQSAQVPLYLTDASGGINRVTEATQMPGMLRMQLIPDQPCGLKLTGVGEDRIFSDNP